MGLRLAWACAWLGLALGLGLRLAWACTRLGLALGLGLHTAWACTPGGERSRGGLGHFGRLLRSAGSGTSGVSSGRRRGSLRSASARAAARLLSSSRSVVLLACSFASLSARAAAVFLLASSFASPCVLLAAPRRLPPSPPSLPSLRLPPSPPSLPSLRRVSSIRGKCRRPLPAESRTPPKPAEARRSPPKPARLPKPTARQSPPLGAFRPFSIS